MITLTDSAVKAVSRFIKSAENPAEGLRIQVTGGGCSGLQYSLKLEAASSPADTIVEYGDVKVIVDAESLPKIDGIVVDFVDSLEGSGFKFTNPNATKSCACGSSFAT